METIVEVYVEMEKLRYTEKLMEIDSFDEEKANGIIELLKAQFEEEE